MIIKVSDKIKIKTEEQLLKENCWRKIKNKYKEEYYINDYGETIAVKMLGKIYRVSSEQEKNYITVYSSHHQNLIVYISTISNVVSNSYYNYILSCSIEELAEVFIKTQNYGTIVYSWLTEKQYSSFDDAIDNTVKTLIHDRRKQ